MNNAIGPRDMSRIAKALESIVWELRRMQEPDCRTHGKWILDEDADDVRCSICGHLALLRVAMGDVGLQEYSNYCPNCGADMRGGNE